MAISAKQLFLLFSAASATAGCSSEAVSAPAEKLDSQPPVMVWLIGPDEPVNPGDSILVRFYAQDNVGITRLGLRVSGAFEQSDSIDLEEPLAQFTAVVNVRVPEGVRLDVPAKVTLIVTDEAGHTAEKGTDVQLLDSRGPATRLNLFGLRSDGTIRSGETLQIHVSASDNQQLAYIGYSGPGLRDSVPASGIVGLHVFRLTVPPSWVRERPTVSVWARDAAGHASVSSESSRRQVAVYDWADRPVQTVPVPSDLYLRQVLWDAKRNAVYLVRSESETDGRIDGIDVVTGTPLASIPLPSSPARSAFSVSGDSLIVPFWHERALGVVDLLKPARSTTVVPLQYDAGRAGCLTRYRRRASIYSSRSGTVEPGGD